MMEHSKNIYNSALFFQRRWYCFTRCICEYYILHINEYIELFSKHDIVELFKYSLKQEKIDCIKKLYVQYGNKSLLEYVKDDGMKDVLKNLSFTRKKSQVGVTQSSKDILECIKFYETTCEYNNIVSSNEDKDKLLREFLPKLKTVVDTLLENNELTRNRNERHLMVMEDKYFNEDIHKLYVQKVKKKPVKTNNKNLIPPTYLNMSYMDLYVKQNIPSYKQISSQAAQQTIKKVQSAYESFFGLIKNGYKASTPRYIKTNKYNVIFQSNSFVVKGNQIRIAVGKTLKAKIKEENQTRNDSLKEDEYLYFHLPPKLKPQNIAQVELVPSQYKDSCSYKFIMVYDVENNHKKRSVDNVFSILSIDLGISNLATVVSPCLSKPIIISGKQIVALNRRCNMLIDNIKSDISVYKELTCNRIQSILTNRENRIYDFFSKASSFLVDCCKKYNIVEIVLGYNKSWKNKVNMGRKNNRSFYEIPYRKFIKMLFDKCELEGINVVETEESYTSKCDGLGLEEVCKHEKYAGKRIKRGLFQSSRKVLINADVNGAINILRKYIAKTYCNLVDSLKSFLQTVSFSKLCNPVTIGRNKAGPDVL